MWFGAAMNVFFCQPTLQVLQEMNSNNRSTTIATTISKTKISVPKQTKNILMCDRKINIKNKFKNRIIIPVPLQWRC